MIRIKVRCTRRLDGKTPKGRHNGTRYKKIKHLKVKKENERWGKSYLSGFGQGDCTLQANDLRQLRRQRPFHRSLVGLLPLCFCSQIEAFAAGAASSAWCCWQTQ